jgi:hypothetical protein
MSVFDITENIVFGGRPAREAIMVWLTENVGEYYGRGEAPVMYIGQGWEMLTDYVTDDIHEEIVISFKVDITDETKSTLFALKWIK